MFDGAQVTEENIIPNDLKIDCLVDVKGLNCPMPIVKARAALKSLSPGQIVHVLATDPHSVIDFKAFCARTGHELLHYTRGPEIFEFYLKRSG